MPPEKPLNCGGVTPPSAGSPSSGLTRQASSFFGEPFPAGYPSARQHPLHRSAPIRVNMPGINAAAAVRPQASRIGSVTAHSIAMPGQYCSGISAQWSLFHVLETSQS